MQLKGVPAAADRVRTFAELAALIIFAALVTVFVESSAPSAATISLRHDHAYGLPADMRSQKKWAVPHRQFRMPAKNWRTYLHGRGLNDTAQ